MTAPDSPAPPVSGKRSGGSTTIYRAVRNFLHPSAPGRRFATKNNEDVVPGNTWPTKTNERIMVNQTNSELEALQAALGTRARLRQWAEGAQVLDLLRAAAATGWLEALTRPVTVENLAGIDGISTERARRVVEVFLAAGVVREAEAVTPAFVLAEGFAALQAGPSGIRTDVALDAVGAARDRVCSALSSSTLYDWQEDALVVARDWGMLPSDASRALFGMAYAEVPDYRDRLAAGGPLLDVGSGIGGALLSTLTTYPALRAVGVERAGDVVKELRERAEDAGVLSRLEIRHTDAQELDDEAVYGVCYWAQAFFPQHTRETTLAAIRRALAPGGLLLVQELAAPADDLGSFLDALVADCRGVPPVVRAEDLAAELRAGGFTDVEVVSTPVGRLVLGRRGQ
ncbi:class I SAM-dependent methyltransferase [Streptomyces sp. NPDC094472]|uniref:SAM-dependent methyltransferase n=1 Tax=unclassified Streptomyces TaxID=2593676 RepID=UPI00331B8E53